MIEKMIMQAKKYLPLKISEITWDETVFQIHGIGWNFVTLSAWRISEENKLIVGCYDNESTESLNELLNTSIVDIYIQSNYLKIDPIFLLSNNRRIEIFSTDTFEPWTLQIEGLGFFVPTPSEPEKFQRN